MLPAHEIVTQGKVEAEATEVAAKPVPNKDELVVRISAAGTELRNLILEAKKLPRDRSLEAHQEEMRCLSQAQNHLQTGMMWLRRAVNPSKEF